MRTREEFFKAGRDAGFAGTYDGHELSRPGWRATAYEAGYAAGKADREMHAQRSPGKSTFAFSALLAKKTAAHFSHWPGAAAEHLQRLALSACDETDPKRIARLMRACGRLAKRHGPPKSNDEALRLIGWDELVTKPPQNAPERLTTQQKEQA